MNQLTAFYELKERVLLRYREVYPYASTEWKTVSSKDIQQLIDDIEQATRQRVSEKWMYTHLKPAENEKLPRRDMLDILSAYCRFDSWDAFVHTVHTAEEVVTVTKQTPTKRRLLLLLGGILLGGGLLFYWKLQQPKGIAAFNKQEKVKVKDFYTQEDINDSTIQLFVKEKNTLKPLNINDIPATVLEKKSELIVESPFYSEAIVAIKEETKTIVLKPDDHAMMLKAFMQSDIKDWETRKVQLNTILSPDLEVLIHLQNGLGIEYMNKEEFTQKLTIPTQAIKRWQVLSLEQDTTQRIIKIRIKQN